MAHQRVGLSETLPEHRQRQINGELHAGSGADRAKQVDAAAELVEHRLGAVEIPSRATSESEQLSIQGRADGATDRTFQQRRLPRAYLVGQRPLGFRLHRAHFDEELAGNVGRQQAEGTTVNGVDGRSIGQNRYRQVGVVGEFPRRRRDGSAVAGKRSHLLGIAIPHDNVVSDVDQSFGDGAAHAPKSRNSDHHDDFSSFWLSAIVHNGEADARDTYIR